MITKTTPATQGRYDAQGSLVGGGPIQTAADLRNRIRDIAAAEPDPARITGWLLRTLTTPDEFRVIATVALHEYVRRIITRPPTEAPTRMYETPQGGRTPSSKVASIRDWVERDLARSVCVDEAAREWLHLGDCSAEACTSAAAIRRVKAAACEAEADWFESAAKAIEHAQVDTIRDLPRDTLEDLLRRWRR